MCDIVYLMASNTDEKKTEFISLRVTKSVKNKLEDIAVQNDRPLSWVVNKILEKYVTSKKPGKL